MKKKKTKTLKRFCNPCDYSSTYMLKFYVFPSLTKYDKGQKKATSI